MILQVKTMYVTAYHPQANGMTERSNHVIKDSLATLVDQIPNDRNDLLYLLTEVISPQGSS